MHVYARTHTRTHAHIYIYIYMYVYTRRYLVEITIPETIFMSHDNSIIRFVIWSLDINRY
jgi:hypothetical protein